MSILEQLDLFFHVTQIPMKYVTGDEERLYAHASYSPDFFPKVEKELLQSGLNAAYTVSTEHIAFGLLRFDGGHLLLGPAPAFDLGGEMLEEALQYANLPLARGEELIRFLRTVACIDLRRFHAIIHYLAGICLHAGAAVPTYVDYPPPSVKAPIASIDKMPQPTFDQLYLSNQAFGKQVMGAIRHGKVDVLEQELSYMGRTFTVAYIQLPTVEDLHDKFVLALAFAAQAAISGGLSYTVIDSMIAHYLALLGKLNNFRDIVRLMKYMFIDYATRVHRMQLLDTEDALVRKICFVIEHHLHEKVTPTLIGERLSKSPAYLCNHFRRATGMTISDYVNQRKVDESRYLLLTTADSVTDIAIQMGFSSSNYYSEIFSKLMGIAPAQYRRQHSAQREK